MCSYKTRLDEHVDKKIDGCIEILYSHRNPVGARTPRIPLKTVHAMEDAMNKLKLGQPDENEASEEEDLE